MSCLAKNVCKHSETYRVNGSTFCSTCSEEVFSFSKDDNVFFDDTTSKTLFTKKQNKSIRKELDAYDFPDNVKTCADKLYAEKVGNNTYRSNVRKEVIFGCVCEAYEQLKIYKDPQEISKIMGIKNKGMSRGLKHCSPLCTGKATKTELFMLSPIDLIPKMLENIGIEYDKSHIDDISNIYNYVRKRSDLINRSSPQSIASALIFFYLRNKDQKVVKSEVARNCGVSAVTISKLDAEITSVTDKATIEE